MEDRGSVSVLVPDSLIVAAAQAAGCEAVLTEHLQHGLEIDGLRIADPFQTAVGSLS